MIAIELRNHESRWLVCSSFNLKRKHLCGHILHHFLAALDHRNLPDLITLTPHSTPSTP